MRKKGEGGREKELNASSRIHKSATNSTTWKTLIYIRKELKGAGRKVGVAAGLRSATEGITVGAVG